MLGGRDADVSKPAWVSTLVEATTSASKVYEELSQKLPVALLGEGGDPGAKVHNHPQGPSEQTGV